MQFGFTSTSFRQLRNTEKIAQTARRAGADVIEWGGDVHVKNLSDAAQVKKLSDACGIGVCSYGSYYRIGSGNADEWKRICEIAAAMGCSSVRVWLGNKDSEKTAPAV